MKIKYGIFSVLLSLVLILSATYSYKNYINQKDLILNKTNEKLYAAAIMAKAILPNNYHDNIVDFSSVPKNEFNDIVDKFNKLCIDLDMEYLWSLMEINGKIVFTSSTSPDKIVANQKHAKFLELHSNPELYYEIFETQQTQYQHNIDKWGRIQVVLVPFHDSNGRPYLFGASIKLSNLDNLLKKNFQESAYLCITFIFIGLIFSLILSKLLSDPLNQLANETSAIASGKFDKIIAEKGFYELVSLKHSFNRMAMAIKQQIAAIVKSKNQLSSYINNTPVGVISWDLELKVIDWNPAAESIFGYTRNEAIGKYVQELILLDNKKEVVNGITNDLISRKGGERRVNENTTKEGKLILCDWYNSVIKDIDGKIIGIASFVNDITERNQLEKINHTMFAISTAINFSSNLDDLYKQVHKLVGGIIDVTNFFIAIVSEKKHTLYFPYYVDTVDEDFSPITDFNPKDSLTGFVASTRKPLLLKKEKLQEMSQQNGVRGPTPVIWMGAPLIIKDEIIGVIAVQSYTDPCIYSDKDLQVLVSISDQVATAIDKKQTEDELKESEKKYKTLFEKTSDAIFIVNKKSGRYLDANESALRLTGRNWSELRQLTTQDVAPKRAENRLQKLNESKTIQDLGQTEYIRPDGEKRVTMLIAIPLSEDTVIGIARDITEELILNERLRQSQKMESIGTLAGGIAHDFNNILFPIVGHAEMLLEDVPEDSPFRNGLNEIYSSALRAKDLVKQILTFSRQESGEIKLMKMQPIIKEALKLIRSTIPTTIYIKQYIRNDCGIIKADPTQIHQIVMNLATNAYHAMEETGGELKVSLKEVELGKLDLINSDMAPGVYACLTVADTGIGMDKVLTEKIFDPFFSTKVRGKGTGMGLSVVHGIVTGMKGVIKVYSEPGKGTEFNIYLPMAKSPSEKQDIHQIKEPILGGSERILLVDDEDVIVAMEKLMLERLGYKVTSRTSSIEALEAFRANPTNFDLVITDMAMPNMPGDKLSAELVKINPDIPVLLCTGFSETMSEEKATSLGINGFLLKPIVMKDLSHKIREVLDENKS